MAKPVQIDAQKLLAYFNALKSITGKSERTVIRSEVAKMIERAQSGTKAAKAESIRAAQTRVPDGKRRWTHHNGKNYLLTNRLPGILWNNINASLDATRKRLLSRRGLSKKSWAVMAKSAGLQISTPSYVIRAEGFDLGKVVSATEEVGRTGYVLALDNSSTTNAHSDAIPAFARGVKGRVSYFQTSLKKGVFNSVSTISKRYPGLSTSSS